MSESLSYRKALATDSLENLITGLGTGTDRLTRTFFAPTNFYGFDELAAMYLGWLSRRIVDILPDESMKKGWEIYCPSWSPEKISILRSYTDHYLELPRKLNAALKSERIFGGAIILAIVDPRYGAFANEIPDYLPKNCLLNLQMYDAQQCYPARINFMNTLAKNYRLPESYTIGAAGVGLQMQNAGGENAVTQGTVVHWSRVQRFEGLYLPWYSRQRNLYWGQSCLSSIYEAIRNAGIVDSSIAGLLFRASVPIMKVTDLANIIADPEAREAFMQRVNLMNFGMSNNNMAIIDSEETLENFEASAVSNLDSILERFYVTCSAASGIPVTKLVGESARGLNATGEGDLNNYYDLLEDYQNLKIKPMLLDMYKRWIIPSFYDELMPQDFDIVFPELERQSPGAKLQANKDFIDMLNSAIDSKLIDLSTARRELLERKVFKNYTKEDIEKLEKEAEDNEFQEDELDKEQEGENCLKADRLELDPCFSAFQKFVEQTPNEYAWKMPLILLRSLLRENDRDGIRKLCGENPGMVPYIKQHDSNVYDWLTKSYLN